MEEGVNFESRTGRHVALLQTLFSAIFSIFFYYPECNFNIDLLSLILAFIFFN